jgi:diaminopimelate decarboxylase
VLRNNGSRYYQLYHPGTPDESISVRNIVNSSVQQAREKGVTCVKVDFFYHVKVITSGEDQSSCIIMRCNPVWNTTETMQSRQKQ